MAFFRVLAEKKKYENAPLRNAHDSRKDLRVSLM